MTEQDPATEEPTVTTPRVPTLAELKAKWKQNLEADYWEADEATW